jgi:transcription termination/antitermination protein NusG
MADIRKWYVLRTFSGQEKRIKDYIELELDRSGMQDMVEEILIPTEQVLELRSGKKRTREKTLFPGYVFIKSVITNELKHIISGLPISTNFTVNSKGEPIPLRPDEISRILGQVKDSAEAGPMADIPYEVGQNVKVIDGPFNNFTGVIEEVQNDKMKLVVMVSIFGRRSPLELDYTQVERE